MQSASLYKDVKYKKDKPSITVLFETEKTKEIGIAMRKGQLMKEHKTPFPIVVEVFDGKIDFGVYGKRMVLEKGDLIALEGSVSHDLKAEADSIIRLTLTNQDDSQRVRGVANE